MVTLLPVRPTHKGVFIDIIDREVTQKDLGNGKVLHLISDDSFGPDGPHNPMSAAHPGNRPRWARVLEIGPEVTEVKIGDLVLCDRLKWSRRIPLGRIGLQTVYFWRISVDDILLINRGADDHHEFVKTMQEQLSRMELHIGKL